MFDTSVTKRCAAERMVITDFQIVLLHIFFPSVLQARHAITYGKTGIGSVVDPLVWKEERFVKKNVLTVMYTY